MAAYPEVVFNSDGWVTGWDDILSYLAAFRKPESVKKLHDKYCFPLHYLPNGTPVIIKSETNAWLRAFSEASSPFRLRRLSGAALRASQGNEIGCVGPGMGKYTIVKEEEDGQEE